jgi:transcriptional antiterminator
MTRTVKNKLDEVNKELNEFSTKISKAIRMAYEAGHEDPFLKYGSDWYDLVDEIYQKVGLL